jgi:3'-phosphoadenosine 5'-phosphosulfate sulfotransferase (PAPS reductase)/FAD synthetase
LSFYRKLLNLTIQKLAKNNVSIVKDIEPETVSRYLEDENPRPWIVEFSGGKEFIMLLQLAVE